MILKCCVLCETKESLTIAKMYIIINILMLIKSIVIVIIIIIISITVITISIITVFAKSAWKIF